MNAIDHIAAVLRAFEIEPRPLDRTLDSYFRRHRELSSSSRRLVSDAAFGVLRWRGRLNGWLAMQGLSRISDRARAVMYLLWARPEGAKSIDLESLSREFGVAAPDGEDMPRSFPGGRAAFDSFPSFLYDMMVKGYGAEGAKRLAASLNAPALPVLRVNLLKACREEAAKRLADEGIASRPTEVSPFGLALGKREPVDATAAFRDGLVEFQDESSQLALAAADPRPGETVLDVCAGAGGKSLMAAMLMENSGRVVASDVDAQKLAELCRRARRAGAGIVEALSADELERRENLKGKVDLVIIDAPCSGTGTLRRAADLKWRLSPEEIAERVVVQRGLLEKYSAWARPGGRVAYITCSILPCENELVVKEFAGRKGFAVIDAAIAFNRLGISASSIVSPEGFFRADPRGKSWDGLFSAVLKRIGD